MNRKDNRANFQELNKAFDIILRRMFFLKCKKIVVVEGIGLTEGNRVLICGF